MNNTIRIDGEMEEFLRSRLDERLAQCTEAQRSKFDLFFPPPVPAGKLKMAIDLCDRTIRKNLEGRRQ